MKPATKLLILFSLFFCVVSSDNGPKVSSTDMDAFDDYRKLQYLARCRIVRLRSGDFQLLPDETLRVEAYNLTLNKTFFDVDNDSATICRPYELRWRETHTQIIPHFAATFILLVCLTFFAIHDYDNLYWSAFMAAFAFYTVNIIGEYIKTFLEETQYKIPHDMHFLGTQYFFWMSSLACDGLLLSFGANKPSRPPRYRISSTRLRYVVIHSFVKLMSVIAFMPFLDVTGIWPQSEEEDSLSNFIRVITVYDLVSCYNLISLLVFFYLMTEPTDREQKQLKAVFCVNFVVFNIMVCGWLLEYFFVVKGLVDYMGFVFQTESVLAYIFVAAGVVKYCFRKNDARLLREMAIIKKVAIKIKGVFVSEDGKFKISETGGEKLQFFASEEEKLKILTSEEEKLQIP